MEKNIAVLAGDGIGPEVMKQALRVLAVVAKRFGHHFNITEALIGGSAYDKYNNHFPDDTQTICQSSDAILFGSVGGPINQQHLDKWKNCEANSILALRKLFSFNANLRPVSIFPNLQQLSPLKAEIIKDGVDLVIVRELLGDSYFGEHKEFTVQGIKQASDLSVYNEEQITNVAHVAFRLARKRRKKLTSVDKANVLTASKLWRAVVKQIAQEYPDVHSEDLLVDNCAMQLIINPAQFDVILTTNMFGDILSDVAAVLPGSLGLLASASLNKSGFGLYEPPGGSAPDLANKNIANPIAQIKSVALLLRLSFNLEEAAQAIDNAIENTLKDGFRTRDIYRFDAEKDNNHILVNTEEMTNQILERISLQQ
jgi:3-isopropylmalate dehydrogenase